MPRMAKRPVPGAGVRSNRLPRRLPCRRTVIRAPGVFWPGPSPRPHRRVASVPAGGQSPPASVRPAHSGRFAPAGTGTGLRRADGTGPPGAVVSDRAGNAMRFLIRPDWRPPFGRILRILPPGRGVGLFVSTKEPLSAQVRQRLLQQPDRLAKGGSMDILALHSGLPDRGGPQGFCACTDVQIFVCPGRRFLDSVLWRAIFC